MVALLLSFQEINLIVNKVVCGPIIQIFMFGTGLYFSIKTGFIQFTKFNMMLDKTLFTIFKKKDNTKKNSVSSFQALTTALAGTLGTGNIVGTATAIAIGGPGALFWIVFSSFFGMITKYAEIILAVKYRRKKSNGMLYIGGPMYYMETGLKNRFLSIIFAWIGLIASLGMGNITQINSISVAMYDTFNIKPICTGAIVTFFIALIILGDAKRIVKATERIIPFLTVFYLLITIITLIANYKNLFNAVYLTFNYAFQPIAAVGGFVGSTVAITMKQGVAKGIFTNEAGMGSSPIAHAMAATDSPCSQGLWGIFEVFIDSVLLCSCTGLAIIASGEWCNGEIGAKLAIDAYSTGLGELAPFAITISILFFAFSSLLSWCFYGECFVEYLFKCKIAKICYKILFLVIIVIGAVVDVRFVWDLSDTLSCLMIIPNIICMIFMRKTIIKMTKEYFSRKNKSK